MEILLKYSPLAVVVIALLALCLNSFLLPFMRRMREERQKQLEALHTCIEEHIAEDRQSFREIHGRLDTHLQTHTEFLTRDPQR